MPGLDFQGLRLALDCGHGALSFIAPAFLRGLGASVVALH
jgi:phosphomannomutase